MVEVTSNASITIDLSSAGNFAYTFFFTNMDTYFYFNVCDSETDVCEATQPFLVIT